MNSQNPKRGTALVAGASSGISAVYAEQLAACWQDLVLVARRADRLDALASHITSLHGVTVRVLVTDLSTEPGIASVEALLGANARITILANMLACHCLDATSTSALPTITAF